MDDAGVRGGVGEAPPGRYAAPGDFDRMEALEQQVRQLTSRLAGWVEAQLVQAVDDRRDDMKALRAELQVLVNEQLAGMRAESSSLLSVATRRLEVGQEQLAERVETVAERAAEAAATTKALSGSSAADSERVEALEQRVKSAVSRLSDSVEARLAELDQVRQSELDALRSELAAIDKRVGQHASAADLSATRDRLAALSSQFDRRLDEITGQAVATTERLESVSSDVKAGPARIDAFEQRLKAAMGRLTDSVETRLAETATTRATELQGLRSELASRIDELERTGSERVDAVALRTSAISDDISSLRDEAKAGTARSDELEQRVKAAVGRLAESVETKLAEHAAQLEVRVEEARDELRAAVDNVQGQVTTALRGIPAEVGAAVEPVRVDMGATLDAQLAETRAQITLALRDGRVELAAGTAQLDALQVALEEQAAKTAASLDALNTSVEATLWEAEVRLGQTVQAKLAEFEAFAAGVARARTDLDSTVASLHRKMARAEDDAEKRLAGLTEQVGALTKVAATEAGSLAPLRSDLHLLRVQVTELAEVVADLRPKRKPPAAPAKKVAAARAKKAPAKKAAGRKAQ